MNIPENRPEIESCETAAEICARQQAELANAVASLKHNTAAVLNKRFGHVHAVVKRAFGSYCAEVEAESLGDDGLYLEQTFREEQFADPQAAAVEWATAIATRLAETAAWDETFHADHKDALDRAVKEADKTRDSDEYDYRQAKGFK